MASINSWIFIFIGAIVTGVSYFMYDDLWAFIYVGAAFIAYGIIKTLINRKNKKDEKTLEKEFNIPNKASLNVAQKYLSRPENAAHQNIIQQNPNQYYSQHNPQHIPLQKTHPYNPQQYQHPDIQHQHTPIICHNCGNGLRIHDNFCPHCGKRQH
jgi:hypothetical protein